MKISCDVLQDLYPNYIDGICSGKSKLLVEEHLKECESCRGLIKDMAREMEDLKLEEGPEDKLSKRTLLKVAGKKYFTVFMVAALFFLSGFYNIFAWAFSGIFFFSPEEAIVKANPYINNAEVIFMENVERNIYAVIYEDGIEFGTGFVKKRLGGIFWSYQGVGGNASVPVGRPFGIAGRGRNIGEKNYMLLAVKVNDPRIKYIALDQNEYSENLTTLDSITDKEGFIIREVVNGYVLFSGENITFSGRPRGFTEQGAEVSYNKYRLISGGGVNGE